MKVFCVSVVVVCLVVFILHCRFAHLEDSVKKQQEFYDSCINEVEQVQTKLVESFQER